MSKALNISLIQLSDEIFDKKQWVWFSPEPNFLFDWILGASYGISELFQVISAYLAH